MSAHKGMACLTWLLHGYGMLWLRTHSALQVFNYTETKAPQRALALVLLIVLDSFEVYALYNRVTKHGMS